MPLSGCLRRICLAEGLAPAAGANYGMCQQLGSKQSWVRRERRSRAGGGVQKGGTEVTGDQWDALNPGAHGNQLHTFTCPQPPLHKPQLLWLPLASFRFLCGFPREDPSADVSVWMWNCLWLDHRAWNWENRRKVWDFSTISQ